MFRRSVLGKLRERRRGRRGRRHPRQQCFPQLCFQDGFGQVCCDAEFPGAPVVHTLTARGQHHDDGTSAWEVLLDVDSQGKAVHVRHRSIEQHQRKGSAQLLCLPEHRHSVSPTHHRRWTHTPVSEQLGEMSPVHSVIIDNQDRKPLYLCDVCERRRLYRLGMDTEARRKVESTPVSHHALDP